MRCVPLFVCLALAPLFWSCDRFIPSKNHLVDAHSHQGEACPLKTAKEWQAFLERAADNKKWAVTCEDSACDEKYYAYVQTEVRGTFEKCANYVSSHPAISQCTQRLRRFTTAWLHQHDPENYGFNVNNHEYLTAQEAPDKPPGMMKVPQAIIDSLPSRTKVEAAARKSGLKYLTHNSALGGSRTFIFNPDPKGRYDQWFLLNLQDEKDAIKSQTPLSIIVVQKKTLEGKALPKVRLHFRDYTIYPETTGYRLQLHETNNGKCYSCHPNGVRQLIERRTPVLQAEPVLGEDHYGSAKVPRDFAEQRLIAFNRKLRSYGGADWTGQITPEDHGPALGGPQGCLECHNGESRAALNVSISMNQIRQKVMFELNMPYDSPMPALLERVQMSPHEVTMQDKIKLEKALEMNEALTDQFEAARFPTLKSWLLENPCTQGG